jgi:hypothetical protein
MTVPGYYHPHLKPEAESLAAGWRRVPAVRLCIPRTPACVDPTGRRGRKMTAFVIHSLNRGRLILI